MTDQNQTLSLRGFAKQMDISHSTLSKIMNGKYGANPDKMIRKIIETLQGAVIPASKYDEILQMLDDTTFPKFGKTSRTASWLYELITEAKQKASQ